MAKKNKDDAEIEVEVEAEEAEAEVEDEVEVEAEEAEAEVEDEEEKFSAKDVATMIDRALDKREKRATKDREDRQKKRQKTEVKGDELKTLYAEEQEDHEETKKVLASTKDSLRREQVANRLRRFVAKNHPHLLPDADEYILPRIEREVDADTDDAEADVMIKAEVKAYASRHPKKVRVEDDEDEQLDDEGVPSGSSRGKLPTNDRRNPRIAAFTRKPPENKVQSFTGQSRAF